jgi:hypothetical protein
MVCLPLGVVCESDGVSGKPESNFTSQVVFVGNALSDKGFGLLLDFVLLNGG